jgi:cellulose synthase/poly-beta-1,6-N-acetylglucosamine synthase-like glycosyltransferase
MLVLFAVSLGLLAYVLAGYPLLLRLIVAVRGPRPVRHAPITPPISFVISAFNEAAVIAKKLDNTLSLDYPTEARQVVVISDCSDDGTDEIVQQYANRGVTLARMAVRRGKTAGLNATVPTLTGDVVVFSDANAIYEADAVRILVRNFADPDVGCAGMGRRRGRSGGAGIDAYAGGTDRDPVSAPLRGRRRLGPCSHRGVAITVVP